MHPERELLAQAIDDPRHGWSIGIFGAIGEFMRGADEAVVRVRDPQVDGIVTSRGALRVRHLEGVTAVAYDTLSGDGETWSNALAFCLPRPEHEEATGVTCLGADADAIRSEDRDAMLFDLGVGLGHIRMCVRTRDAELIAALRGIEGESLFAAAAAAGRVMPLMLRVGPHRVVLSPLARVEVYAPIPPPDGTSPDGPHTHLLPKLLGSRRTHAANAPIPAGLQPVLMLHPRSPWRDAAGRRTDFDAGLDREFDRLLARYGLDEDRRVRAAVEGAVNQGVDPAQHAWPTTRRARAEARVTLRRLAQRLGPDAVAAWRKRYDPRHLEEDEAPANAH